MYLEYSLRPIDLRNKFTLSSPALFPSLAHKTCLMRTRWKTFLTLNSPKCKWGDRSEVVALSAFLRFFEYSISGPFMKVVNALLALLHPGDHARARSALLAFSNSSSNSNVSLGHLDASPEIGQELSTRANCSKAWLGQGKWTMPQMLQTRGIFYIRSKIWTLQMSSWICISERLLVNYAHVTINLFI